MATSYHLLKKRGVLKSTQISFLRAHRFSLSLIMVTPLGMSRAKFRVRLKVTNYLPLFFFFGMMLLFVWLSMSWDVWMIFFVLFVLPCWLLKALPNCHSVCHLNNKYCMYLSQHMVEVTMDHWSSLDSGTQWWTHQLIAQSHWIISCWL